MPTQTLARVTEMTPLNDFAWSMTLEVSDMIRTTLKNPGQFVHVKCGDQRLLRRPISVCSCSEDSPSDLLRLVFEVRGDGTDWLAHRTVGDKVDVMALPSLPPGGICWWVAASGCLPCWAVPSPPPAGAMRCWAFGIRPTPC